MANFSTVITSLGKPTPFFTRIRSIELDFCGGAFSMALSCAGMGAGTQLKVGGHLKRTWKQSQNVNIF